MENLINDINTCLLSLYSGDKVEFKKYDIVSLRDQLESNPKFTGSEFMLLRKAFIDLFDDDRSKLLYYKTRTFVPELNNVPEHEIIKDIYTWAGSKKEPYFERYISLIKIKINNSQELNQKIDFKIYLKHEWADKIGNLLRNKSKNGKPAEKAKWIFVIYKKGLFKPEKVPDEKSLYAQNTNFIYRNFYHSFQALTETKVDQEKGIKEQIKTIFDEWEGEKKKKYPPENDPILRKYFEEINKILVK